MKTLKIKNVNISVLGANGEMHDYLINNEYQNTKKEDVINIFKLEKLHYATNLDECNLGQMKSFNTYNWNAPFTLCGVLPEDIYDGVAIVNIHLGGDARGNYSEPYICEDVESLLSQKSYLNVELSDGQTFSFDCDNGEGYFNFDNFDPYYVDFDSEITPEILTDLKDNCI